MDDANARSSEPLDAQEGTDDPGIPVPSGTNARMRELALAMIAGGSGRNVFGEPLHGGNRRKRRTIRCGWCGRAMDADRWTCACGARRESMGGTR